jgi:hypothetical protein
MIQFQITVTDLEITTVDTVIDTEDLLSVIIGQNMSYTKVIHPNHPYSATITISRVNVEE